jgi:hypothetical protein
MLSLKILFCNQFQIRRYAMIFSVKVYFVLIFKIFLLMNTEYLLNRRLYCSDEFLWRLSLYLKFFFHRDIFGKIFLGAFYISKVEIIMESSYNLFLRMRRLELLEIHPILIRLTTPLDHIPYIEIVAAPSEPFIQEYLVVVPAELGR